MNHGMTVGELHIVDVKGWSGEPFVQTGLPWVMPSPEMPTPDTALVYAGACLFEATNLSEGRGTTRPFELVDAPFMDHRWAEKLREVDLPGVTFRQAWFTPTTSRHVNPLCGSVQVHVAVPSLVGGPATAVHMLTTARTCTRSSAPGCSPATSTRSSGSTC